MKILVTGAGGFLGGHVVEVLLTRGHSVRAMIRPSANTPSWSERTEIVRADLRVPYGLEAALEGVDAVVHAAAATVGDEDAQFASSVIGTEHLMSAMAASAGPKALLLISSLVVYDWSKAEKVLDERTPPLNLPYDFDGYTIAKVWQERLAVQAARAHDWTLTILRPGFIWGRGHAEIAGMGRRFGPLHLVFGPLSRLPLTYVANCAEAVVAALERPTNRMRIYNVIDSDEVRAWSYARAYSAAGSGALMLIPIPYKTGLAVAHLAALVSRWAFGSKGKLPSLLQPKRYERQFKNVRFPNEALVSSLSWRPRLMFEECLALTYGKFDPPTGASNEDQKSRGQENP